MILGIGFFTEEKITFSIFKEIYVEKSSQL